MHPKLKLLLACGFCTLAQTDVRSQSLGPASLTAAGGSRVVDGVTYEFAVGQLTAGDSKTAPGILITPGVIQPSATNMGVAGIPQAQLQVFPNPATTELFLQPAFAGPGDLSYILYDVAGRVVFNRNVRLQRGSERQSLPVRTLAAGQYILQVLWKQGDQTSGSAYQVQKIK